MSVPITFAAAFTPAPSTSSSTTTITTTQSFTTPLAPGDITVRITATAINPVDWKFRDTPTLTPFIPVWPTVLGSDAAGEVVQIGADFADKFAVGDRVWFQGIYGKPEACTFQQYCRVPAHLVGRVPSKEGFTDDEAAGLSLGSITATIGIYHSLGRGVVPAPWNEGGSYVGKGKAVVVLGGSTSVGQYAVQLARLSGYERIVASAGAKHEVLLKSLGASVVVGRHSWDGDEDGNVQEFVDALGDDLELDWVYDCVTLDRAQEFGVKIVQAAQKVTDGVMVVSVNQIDECAIAAGRAVGGESKKREVKVQGIFALGYHPDYRYVTEPMYINISKWLASGDFVPNRVQVVSGGLKALDEAMDLNKKGVSGVKVIVRPHA